MMFTHTFCVLLAPAVVYGAAFPWALPEPTAFAPAIDVWSPAPTAPARLPGFELFRRDTPEGNNTCAFVSGSLQSSITCSNTNFICATNTRDGVQGCCDPKAMNSCTIPTTCIASSAMATLCTDSACSSNSGIVRCTEAAMPECYKWMIVYNKTIMTQHGCAAQGFTSTAVRSPGQIISSIPPEQYRTATVTVLATPSDSPTLTPVPSPSKPNLGAIVGGTIGGCTIISMIILAIFLIRRRRNAAMTSVTSPHITQYHNGNGTVTEYSPIGFTSMTYPDDTKTWAQQRTGSVTRVDDAMPQYPGMAARQYGIIEVDGMQRPAEAPAEMIHHSRG